jgi:threonine dehydratase
MPLPVPSPANILSAATQIDPVFLHSPLVRHDRLDDRLGCRLLAKLETLNPIRSFKGRGASFFVAGLPQGLAHLVCASAGNFGQGLAYAGRERGLRVTVFAAINANPSKIDAMRRLGADVRLIGTDFDAAKDAAVDFAEAAAAILVVDGDQPAVAEGAGTIALELTQQTASADIVLLPLGNGALAAGMGTWLKHAWPETTTIAVAAAGAPAMAISWREGRPITTPSASTIADGIAVRVPVPYALEAMRGAIDSVTTVADEHILAAMQLVHETLGVVVEPAGAAGLAAILADPGPFRGRTVATVLCGGNLTPTQMRDWLFSPTPPLARLP